MVEWWLEIPGIKACDSVILSDLLKFLEQKHSVFVDSVKIFKSIGHIIQRAFGCCTSTTNYHQLVKSAAISAEIQSFESVYHRLYSTCLLLGAMEEPVLQNQTQEPGIALKVRT